MTDLYLKAPTKDDMDSALLEAGVIGEGGYPDAGTFPLIRLALLQK
jgi:hypothetical protein